MPPFAKSPGFDTRTPPIIPSSPNCIKQKKPSGLQINPSIYTTMSSPVFQQKT